MIPYKFNPLGISRTSKEYFSFLTFTAIQDNSSVTLTQIGTPNTINLYYKTSSSNVWSPYIIDTEISLSQGQYVQFWNKSSLFSKSATNCYKFSMTGKIAGSGNVQSLLNFINYCPSCSFYFMFQYCTALTTPPKLPAMTVSSECYYGMFNGCTALTVAPELPAIALAYHCYKNMFTNCVALTTAPELPATTLAINCYEAMFLGCTALTAAPELPATNLANNCYNSMFANCSSLSSIQVNFTDWRTDINATANWVTGVAASGDFYCNSELLIPIRGNNYIPSGWNVIPKDVILGKIIEENGVKKFGVLSFDGTSATIDRTESFDNVYSFNTLSGEQVNYTGEQIEDIVELGQIIDDNGTQKFASLEFNGTTPTLKEIKTYTNVYEYNK